MVSATERRAAELVERAEHAENRVQEWRDEQATLHEQIGELRGELKAVMRQLGQAE